ncbi:MAG: tRNA preQ1(34) S-adenosylmethionine ribosyltransferase-isomerase QueA [Anaerolineaceae bacterium]|nr:tRNA preQ1(34) S-adenosylmethionine ribosyltransferase-isomerase QueA [Anaerolineaceae bacterium]
MKTTDFDYALPPERIAQTPVEPRHSSRLLVVDRALDRLAHRSFWEIGDYLKSGDLLVLNQTRVIKARIFARKETGGRVELLLLNQRSKAEWEALAGGKGVKAGRHLMLEDGPGVEVIEELEGASRVIRFEQPIDAYLEEHGQMPLPPYIHERLMDPERYQTVYARETGSAAAPTAGLHFTPELIEKLKKQGIRFAYLTLHVGLDTFAPVTRADPAEHKIHSEWCELDSKAAELINTTRCAGGRIIAVGTTSVRTLESAASHSQPGEVVASISGPTSLFILPGYQFKVVEAMLTNFHLPRSTLLMLVSAFTGRERLLAIYREAIRLEYRFYSFGDAMLII